MDAHGHWLKRLGVRSPSIVLTFLGVLAALLAWAPPVSGDLLHFKSGAIMDIGWTYRVADGKVHVIRPEGTVSIPVSDMDRIEKTERKAPPEDAEQAARGSASERPQTPEASSGTPTQERREALPGGDPIERDRQDLLGVVTGALDMLKDADRPTSPAPEEIRKWEGDVKMWRGRVGEIQENAGKAGSGPADTVQDAAADLLAALEDLQAALEDSDLDRAKDLEGPLGAIQEKLRAPIR